MMQNLPEQERSRVIDEMAKSMLKMLFGGNVAVVTQLHYFEIEKEETEPEYYISDKYKHFDFWFNPAHNVVSQLAVGLSDLYHQLTGIPGDKYDTASTLAKSFEGWQEQ